MIYKIFKLFDTKMEWTTIIVAIVGALAGGGLVSLLTIRETKKGKQLENKEKEEDIENKNSDRWEKLADQLSEQIEKLNIQITDLNNRLEKKDELLEEKNDIISDLKTKLDKTRSRYIASDMCRCLRVECKDREPSWGSRVLDVEKLVVDTEK